MTSVSPQETFLLQGPARSLLCYRCHGVPFCLASYQTRNWESIRGCTMPIPRSERERAAAICRARTQPGAQNTRINPLVVGKSEARAVLLPSRGISDVGIIKAGNTLEDFWPHSELVQTVARRGLNSQPIICVTLILKCVFWDYFAAPLLRSELTQRESRFNKKHA